MPDFPIHYIYAIDPGYKGGIARFDLEKHTLSVTPTPIIKGNPKKKIKDQYDLIAMGNCFDRGHFENIAVCIEQVGAMPGQGVTSMFNFGMGYGIWLGIIGANRLYYEKITPRVWKKDFDLSQDKDASRLHATNLFPQCADLWKLKKHDGLAEAALIGYYLIKKLGLVDAFMSVPVTPMEYFK